MHPADSGFLLFTTMSLFPFVHYTLYIYTSLWSVGGAGWHTPGDPENHIPNTSPAHANSLSRHHLSILSTFISSTVSFRFSVIPTQPREHLLCRFFLIRTNIPESNSGCGLRLLLLEAC
jgi:uncharacterized membrane protein YbhN (UPF0104 family)